MKFTALRKLCLVAAPLMAALAFAGENRTEKHSNLTLEDVIFDASYLKQFLGAKTLVTTAEKNGKFPVAVLHQAGLDEKTAVYALPDEAGVPALKSSLAPTYPQSFRLRRDKLEASFLLYIGANGEVKCLYCYETTDRLYAIATADALIKWRYTPAKIGDTAVPVLVSLQKSLNESDLARMLMTAPKPSVYMKDNPSAIPPKAMPR